MKAEARTTGARIRVRDLEFAYGGGPFRLRIPDLGIEPGEKIACIGPSGSGKSTFLNLLAGILLPDAGAVLLDDVDWKTLDDGERRAARSSRIGLVFQELELLEHLSVLENIQLPFLVRGGTAARDARERCLDAARSVGIEQHVSRHPRELSQGERQRVALCRSIVTDPALLLADEPTGNLDPVATRSTVELLLGASRERGMTLVFVTHDHSLIDRFDRVIDFTELAT